MFPQCLKTAQKSLIFTSEASYVNFQKKLGLQFFAPYKFFGILANSAFLRYEKNHQEPKRIFKGQKRITKGFQSNQLVMP